MQNLEIIKGIVKKHFFIDEEGFKMFSDRLDTPVFNDSIKKILENSEERRARFDLPDDEMHRFDQGWKEFRENLSDFVRKYNVSYQDYRENLITVGKQKFKIKKVLFDFYKEKTKKETIVYNNGLSKEINQNTLNAIFNLFYETMVTKHINGDKKVIKNNKKEIIKLVTNIIKEKEGLKEVLKNLYRKLNRDNSKFFETRTSGSVSILFAIRNLILEDCSDTVYLIENKNITSKTVVYTIPGSSRSTSESELEGWVTNLTTKLTSNKISKDKKIQIVLSGNFSDWFLASTAEEWKSCINLESEYASSFWAGLPGLVGDPNRLMIYVTDGKKKTYEGITTDRFLSRTWMSHTNKDQLCLIRWFPIKMVEKDLIEKLTGIKCIDGGETNWRTKNPITLINGDIDGEKRSLFIYNDGCGLRSEGENIYISSNGSSGFATVLDNKEIKGMSLFNYSNGLRSLIRDNKNIVSYATPPANPRCPICKIRHNKGNMNQTEDGYICPSCFRELYARSYVGDYKKKDSMTYISRLDKYFTNDEKRNYLLEINGEFLLIDKEIFKINGYDGWYKKEEIVKDFNGLKIPAIMALTIGKIVISKKEYDLYGFNQENDWGLPEIIKRDLAVECLGYWVPRTSHVVTVDNLILKKDDINIVRHNGFIYHKDTAANFNILFNEKTKRWYKWVDKTQREFKFETGDI